jgi:hypothetical protein
MKSITRLSAALFAASLTTACATMGTGSYAQPGVDLNAYRTYDWAAADALPTGDPRLDRNAIFIDQFEGAVEKGLALRGLQRVSAEETPDLLVHYHATVTQRVFVNEDPPRVDACRFDDCRPRVEAYEAGTLVIDIVDARTKRLVWRGWAEDDLAGALANQERFEQFIDDAVAGMLQRLPRPLVPPVNVG